MIEIYNSNGYGI